MNRDNSWADVIRQTAMGQITNWADEMSDDGDNIHQSIAQVPSTSASSDRLNSVVCQELTYAQVVGDNLADDVSNDGDNIHQSIAQAQLGIAQAPSTSASSDSVVCPDLTYAQVVEKPANSIHQLNDPDDHSLAQHGTHHIISKTYAQIVGTPDIKKATNVVCGEPGDPIGIRAVQSILMSATQMNLSHFHTAGMTGSVAGMHRPSPADAMNNVFTNTSMMFDSNDNVYDLRRQIVGASLKSFVTTVGGSFTVLPDRENVWYDVLNVPMFEGNILRIYIDYKKMRNHGLTLKHLADKSFGEDIMTRVSPDFMGMIDVEVPNDHISQWLARIGSLVCGTYNIQSCDKNSGHVAAVTQGSDVLAVSKIHSINKRTIQSNNVAEVEKFFGIEAAAAVLQDLTGSHIVSDFMARTGVVLPFTKNSIEVARKGLLTAMGFERPKDDMRAAVKAFDAGRAPVCSTFRTVPFTVYESIMTGTEPPCNFEIITP